jgi:hypothetical protein
MHTVLADSNRRSVLRQLMTRGSELSVADLVDGIVCRDRFLDDAHVTDRRRCAIALRHVHLPMLAETGLVDWDREAETVSLTPLLTQLTVTTPAVAGLIDMEVTQQRAPE